MKRIIIDFDNTMGIKGCDVDDGLALLYLLGNPDRCIVEAVTCAYGNSTIETVHSNTCRLFALWGLGIPVYKGAAGPDDPMSEAAEYLARAVAEAPGEISLLVTGSTTNLRGAALVDPHFFQNVKEIVLMGGITESLVINGRIMDELNLSCDPAATLELLSSGAPVSIATSQHCLPAFFSRDTFAPVFPEGSWLSQTIEYWFGDMDSWYEWNGFTAWDLVAAAMLIKPELFTPEPLNVSLYQRFLSVGYLESAAPDAPQATIQTPIITNPDALIQDALQSWKRALSSLGM